MQTSSQQGHTPSYDTIGSGGDRKSPSAAGSTAALALVKLQQVMERTSGVPEVRLGLLDGPVALDHPAFAAAKVRAVSSRVAGVCTRATSEACMHGTLVAGVLAGRRESGAPGICPGCTILVRPIFVEGTDLDTRAPVASLHEVASAIVEAVGAGARVLNLSAAVAQPSSKSEREVEQALDYAASRDAIVVAAAGNQGALGSSAITRHPWVIPVIACDLRGRPMADSNLTRSVAQRGLAAPGEGVVSVAPGAALQTFSGTSAAAPFVTGAIALLWSLFPGFSASRLRCAVTQVGTRRSTLVPPLLDGWRAHQSLSM